MKFRILIISSLVLLASCADKSQPIRIQGEAQGTYYSIAYYDDQQRDLKPQIDSLLQNFDQTASLWVENSLIRRINRNEDSVLNDDFYAMLKYSEGIKALTDGAFNCEIGALVNLYGFGFKKRADVSDREIDSLVHILHQETYRIVEDDAGNHIIRKNYDIEFDFNAIAQGYSVDLLASMFDSLGITSYLIDIGGEVVSKGKKKDFSSWVVGIERPAKDKYDGQEIETAIALNNCSVVTSGNYRKYYEKDGIRYSHTIDPETGRPVNHSLLSVSVVSDNATFSDAMATAFMVMGLDNSLKFIQTHRDQVSAVFFIYDDHGKYKTLATPEFDKLIIQ